MSKYLSAFSLSDAKKYPPFVTEILSQMGAETVVKAYIDFNLLALQT